MPTYSYACRDCDHRFDITQSFSEDSLTTCPECRGTLRKVYGSVGVVFKGSGFYRTDSRKGSVPSETASSGSESGSSSSGSSESASSSSEPAKKTPASTGSGTSSTGTSTAAASS